MGLPLAPILIGAGVGALGGAVTGRNPFETALLGAALGTGAGALGIGGATAAGGAGAGLATGAGSAAAGTGISQAALLGSSALPASLGGLGATTAGTGLATGLGSSAAGTGISLGSIAGSSALPTALGGSGLAAAEGAGIANLANYATGTGTNIMAANPTLYDKLKPYATIDNLAGANAIASKFQPKPMSPAPQGRITEGQPMKGGLGQGGVEGLLAELQKRQQQQYQPISLL